MNTLRIWKVRATLWLYERAYAHHVKVPVRTQRGTGHQCRACQTPWPCRKWAFYDEISHRGHVWLSEQGVRP